MSSPLAIKAGVLHGIHVLKRPYLPGDHLVLMCFEEALLSNYTSKDGCYVKAFCPNSLQL